VLLFVPESSLLTTFLLARFHAMRSGPVKPACLH
jgi:hypothetical protein